MNAVRKQKLAFVLIITIIFMLAVALILYALRQNINLFYTPSQIVKGEAPARRMIRVGGMVVKNSVIRTDALKVQFQLTDLKETVTINYQGILPDLFREGQGVVALGELLSDKQHFYAKEVLAKHDANYMPPEVKQTLAKVT